MSADKAPEPLPVGTKIGKFTVEGELGSGGMAIVYAAHDPELDRRIALKVLRAHTATDDAHRMRLLREGQAVAKVSHPNVIIVHEVGIDRGQVFLAQELVEGETLGAWLERPHTEREILDKMCAAGRGLAAAHAAGLVHRDFKPDNVLLGADGRVRVSDFGLARPLAEAPESVTVPGRVGIDALAPTIGALSRSPMAPLTRTGAVMGTPLYMAPEQHLGEATDARSDQFSFCVTLYRALYGTAPFAGETYVALADAVLHGAIAPAPRGSKVAARLRRIVCRGLQTAPADRYPTMDALLDELAFDPARRRHRGLLALGLGVLVAGAVVGGYALRSRGPADDRPIAAASTGKRVVAVLGFKNLSSSPAIAWISTALGELLASELSAGGELRVVSAEDADRARADLGLASAESYAGDTLRAIRARLGVDAVILGSYLDTGGAVTLVTVVEDVADGRTQRFQSAGTEADLAALVVEVGPRIRGALGLKVDARPVATVRGELPKDPIAARAYVEGLAAMRGYDFKTAKARLVVAVERAPDFAPAHAALAEAYAGRFEHAAAREEDAKAVARAGSLPIEQQMMIKARAFARSGEPAKAHEELRRLFALHPDDLEVGLELAAAQGDAPSAQVTLAALRKLPPPAGTDPRIDVFEAANANRNGDRVRALEIVRRGIARARADEIQLVLAAARDIEGQILTDLGDFTAAIPAHEEARQIYERAGDELRMVAVLNSLAILSLERGEADKAFAQFDAVAALRVELGQRSWASFGWSAAAFALALRGRLDEAEAKLKEAEAVIEVGDLGPRTPLALMAGFVAHMRGDLVAGLAQMDLACTNFHLASAGSLESLCRQGQGETLVDQGDGTGARKRFEEGIAIATTASVPQRVATLELARAMLDLDEGQPERAAATALRVQPGLAARGAHDDEAHAWALVARARILQGRFPEAHAALEHSKPDDIQILRIRTDRQIVGAQLAAAMGDVPRALAELAAVRAEAETARYPGLAFDARLAHAEIQASIDAKVARTTATELVAAADKLGYMRIVRRARALAKR